MDNISLGLDLIGWITLVWIIPIIIIPVIIPFLIK